MRAVLVQRAKLIRAGEQEDAEELLGKLCEQLADELTAVGRNAASTAGTGLRALLHLSDGPGAPVASGLELRRASWSEEQWSWHGLSPNTHTPHHTTPHHCMLLHN